MTNQPHVKEHPLYGAVPLIEHRVEGEDGHSYAWYEPDPGYRPDLPTGAIRGDPSRQSYCSALHMPRYFYVDQDRDCIECGTHFVFGAREQRYWYETLQFNLHSVAIRCTRCRQARRRAADFGKQIGLARRGVAASPEDPVAHLDLAEGLVRQRQLKGAGDLDEAIWASRQARRHWPGGGGDPEFWEGMAHWLEQRFEAAEPLLRAFLSHPASNRRRYRTMVEEVEELLNEV